MRGQRRQIVGGPGAGPENAASAGPADMYLPQRNAVAARATRRAEATERANGPRGSDPLRQPADAPSRLAAAGSVGEGSLPPGPLSDGPTMLHTRMERHAERVPPSVVLPSR